MDAAASGDLSPDENAAAYGEVVWSWRRDPGATPAGVILPATGARKAASPGRARISRKAIARGRPGCLGCTCQNRVRSFVTSAHGAAGASSARLSLRPLSERGSNETATTRAKRVAGIEAYVSRHTRLSSPGLSGRSSIPETEVIEPRNRGVLDHPHSRVMTSWGMDCFARNDGGELSGGPSVTPAPATPLQSGRASGQSPLLDS
jgi:hypothetical protein